MEEGRSAFEILTGKPIWKRPLGRPNSWWEDNIRMNLKEIGTSTRNCVIALLSKKVVFVWKNKNGKIIKNLLVLLFSKKLAFLNLIRPKYFTSTNPVFFTLPELNEI